MKLLVFSLFLLYCIDVAVAASPPSVKIAAYKGNKAAAVCYTFDDGLRNQYLLAAPIMEKTGINGTFFIVAGKIAATNRCRYYKTWEMGSYVLGRSKGLVE